MARTPVAHTEVERIERQGRKHTSDLVAVEEPLQILLEHGEAHARTETLLAMTMRTPGHDCDLVAGFLYAEGVLGSIDDLISLRHCARSDTPENVVRAVLRERVVVPSRLLERNLTVLSKEGCERVPLEKESFQPAAIRNALASLEESQPWFRHTGGTHGAALFDNTGALLLHREDVGRHNALDKLVGASLREARLQPGDRFVVVSSRASFELVQKTVRAGFPMLVGFARENRFNVYSNGERIAHEASEPSFVEVEVG
jgi:FdhD protein